MDIGGFVEPCKVLVSLSCVMVDRSQVLDHNKLVSEWLSVIEKDPMDRISEGGTDRLLISGPRRSIVRQGAWVRSLCRRLKNWWNCRSIPNVDQSRSGPQIC